MSFKYVVFVLVCIVGVCIFVIGDSMSGFMYVGVRWGEWYVVVGGRG